jgi:hypothetical protein
MRLAVYLIAFYIVVIAAGCLASTMPQGSFFPNVRDNDEIDRVVTAWRDAGKPYGDRCERERYRIRILHVGESDFRRYCMACGPMECRPRTPVGCSRGCASACFVSDDYGTLHFGSYETPHVVMHEAITIDSADWRATLRHEATHWLESCSGDRAVPQHAGHFWNVVLPALD